MRLKLSLAATALVACATGAFAQSAAPPAFTDQKTIGDFVVRCLPVKSPTPCNMYEEQDDRNSHQRMLSFGLSLAPSANKYLMVIGVPLGVSLDKGLVLVTDKFTSPKMLFRRCDRQGCYVEMVVEKPSIDSLAGAAPAAKVRVVVDGSGKQFDIPFSLNGFSAAHDAMAELAKSKAVAPAQPATAAKP